MFISSTVKAEFSSWAIYLYIHYSLSVSWLSNFSANSQLCILLAAMCNAGHWVTFSQVLSIGGMPCYPISNITILSLFKFSEIKMHLPIQVYTYIKFLSFLPFPWKVVTKLVIWYQSMLSQNQSSRTFLDLQWPHNTLRTSCHPLRIQSPGSPFLSFPRLLPGSIPPTPHDVGPFALTHILVIPL